jgi:hypothetical protein
VRFIRCDLHSIGKSAPYQMRFERPNGLEMSRPASTRILLDEPRLQLAGRRSPVFFRGVGSIELLGARFHAVLDTA